MSTVKIARACGILIRSLHWPCKWTRGLISRRVANDSWVFSQCIKVHRSLGSTCPLYLYDSCTTCVSIWFILKIQQSSAMPSIFVWSCWSPIEDHVTFVACFGQTEVLWTFVNRVKFQASSRFYINRGFNVWVFRFVLATRRTPYVAVRARNLTYVCISAWYLVHPPPSVRSCQHLHMKKHGLNWARSRDH